MTGRLRGGMNPFQRQGHPQGVGLGLPRQLEGSWLPLFALNCRFGFQPQQHNTMFPAAVRGAGRTQGILGCWLALSGEKKTNITSPSETVSARSGTTAPRRAWAPVPERITKAPLCSTGPTESCDCPHALGLSHFSGAAMLLDTSLLPKICLCS